MPHSGGGSSHSGGSHSSHSSHSYGSSHSGGSHGSGIKTSNSYFPGARTFVYYRNNSPVFVYANSDLKNQPKNKLGKIRYIFLLFYLPFIVAIFSMTAMIFRFPKPLTNTADNQIVIEDNAAVLGNTDKILTDSANEVLNTKLYSYLLANSKYNTAQAFESFFTEAAEDAMKKSINWSALSLPIFMTVFIGVHMYFMVFYTGKNPKYEPEELKEVVNHKEKPEVAKCEYCDGLYVVGTDLECPHCVAAVSMY